VARARIVLALTDPRSALLVRGQITFLVARGFDVHLVTGPGEPAAALAAAEGGTHHVVELRRDIAPASDVRALATLTRLFALSREVAGVLFGELGTVVILAQPLGWLIGYGIAQAMVAAFSSDLYRVPFVIGREVFATASLVVCAAALVSAWAIRGRINNLDMIEVLKTRE